MMPSLLLRKPGSLVGLVLDFSTVLLVPDTLEGLRVVILEPSVALRVQLSKLAGSHSLRIVVKDG
jgi:hypothetical protein